MLYGIAIRRSTSEHFHIKGKYFHTKECSLHLYDRVIKCHCSGKFSGCSWSKVKSIASQVSAPALEVNIGFGIRTWFILRFLASVLIGIGGLLLFPISWDFQWITLRWAGWFWFDHPPPFLDVSCSYVEFTFCVCRNLYGLVKIEICIISLIISLLDR